MTPTGSKIHERPLRRVEDDIWRRVAILRGSTLDFEESSRQIWILGIQTPHHERRRGQAKALILHLLAKGKPIDWGNWLPDGERFLKRYAALTGPVWHGSHKKIKKFAKLPKGRTFFAKCPQEAQAYGPHLHKAFLRLANPLEVEDTTDLLQASPYLIKTAKKRGHDGLQGVFLSSVTDCEETIYAVFHPEQILQIP
jgi:hypothetical protein